MNSGKLVPETVSALLLTICNVVNWTGKLVGCAIFEPLLERFGYKKTVYILSSIQIIAVIRTWPQMKRQKPYRATWELD